MSGKAVEVPTNDPGRILNRGTPVDFGDRGQVVVREFTLEDMLNFQLIIQKLMDTVGEETNQTRILLNLLADAQTLGFMKDCAASITGKDRSFYDNFPLPDWLKLFVAVKNVNRWGEMQELFLQLKNSMTSSG